MVTDGILDALPGEDKEQVMGQFLESLEEMPPQDMAERIGSLPFLLFPWGKG